MSALLATEHLCRRYRSGGTWIDAIDQDAFAHAPVPLATLPSQEHVAYSVGAQRGQVVPFQNGLLASYFAGAQYDRLDHQ